uniref:Transcriptional regulator ATRX n=1 Tax=Anopheles culicifacies TaxID=139723 RepID=A0A182MKD1_9DIPT
MEVGDFTESDENYVSVELCSDDEDDDRVTLESNEFSQPKSLLPNEIESIAVETSTYAMNSSVHSDRFLSDHQYLNDNSNRRMRTPVFEAVACEQITNQVEHGGIERFSVTYVEDLGTQDLFNKDNVPEGTVIASEESEEDIAYGQFETKIEIEEPQIQETVIDTDYIGNELIASDLPDEIDDDDPCYSILQSLDSTQALYESENRSLLDNDHSYTTINIITPQPSDQDDTASEDDGSNLRKLVTLSTKLACEGDVTSTGGKKTVERIGKMVNTLLNRSKKNGESMMETNEATVICSPSKNGDSPDRLSVLLSTNCSERLEDDEALPSSGGSLNGQIQEDFGSDTDCTKGTIATDAVETELDELLSLGKKLFKRCEKWVEKSKENVNAATKFNELSQILKKCTRLGEKPPSQERNHSSNSNKGNSMCQVEASVQTDSSYNSAHVQRALNENSKQKLLDSLSNSSSDSSDSEDSLMARSSDSDGESDDVLIASEKRAKEKLKASTVEELGKEKPPGKKRANQIYSDSSAEDVEKHSERDGDENLLDDVLSGVDDIISDCPDVMGVMQDYFEKAEKRQDRDETKDLEKTVDSKHVKDMTESEREDYEDMQIDRLCNFSNLVTCRNASNAASRNTQITTKARDAKENLKNKNGTSMEQFLNDHNDGTDITIPLEPHSEESSESEKDVVETEEQFLKICNENVKLQLLNQDSSSSDETTEEDSLDDRIDYTREENGSNDEDSSASSGSLVEMFLKRHGANITKSKQKKKRSMKGSSDVENSNPQLLTNGQGNTSANVADVEKVSSGNETSTEKQPGECKQQVRIELANPKDKELFSKDLFDASESETTSKKPRKKRKRIDARKARLSDSELESSSEESVMGLANVTPKKRHRKRKLHPTTETLDSSAPTATARKDDKSGADVVANANDSNATSKTPTVSSAESLEKASSPAPGLDSVPTVTERPAKSKVSKDGQDCISLSSDSSDEAELISGDLDEGKTPQEKEPKRRIRPMLTNDELAEETKKAQKEEEGRTARLKKKQEQLKKFMATYKPGPGESDFILDYDSLRKQAICVHPDLVKLLKPHQIEGIQFMYDNTYGSIDALPKHSGSGCILAHCMGLGKTLQMISLLHTVMRYPQLMTNRVLVICPKSTVMNWKEEIARWQGTINTGYQMRVYCFPDVCTQNDKISVLKRWYSCKSPNCGVMLIGYEAFRALINYERRKGSERMRSTKLELIKEYLLRPGADLVICDEGHQIKNKRSAISEAVSKIQTKRRIMLTGTPIQNNLKEYYCMVNFIKPSFLGSDKEFSNLYANPIKNGQCKDSDHQAIKIMKQRSYVLHKKLSKFVQEQLYQVFLQMNEYTSNDITGEPGRTKKFKLIADYTSLRKIWTHPKVLEKAWELANLEKNRKDAIRKTATPDTEDEAPDDINDIASGKLSVTNDWWRQYLQISDLESLYPSNKLWILFEILKQSNERGEKVLIFTAFVSVLNMVEHFMAKIHNQSNDPQQADEYAYSAFKGPWHRGRDYYRLDGKTPKTERHEMITSFNDPLNTITKCFLISAKAGGQGINLTGANRVVILDTSWNPSNDQQNIFRIFRLGQKRKCYVYRLIAVGTMEEKVYSRSVTKQALSYRVVDEQQIDRHYSYDELSELYTLTKVSEMTRETPILPADDVLASLLRTFPNKILKYHEHDSLLENKPEQDLSEEEKKEAWAAYEREIQNNENRSYVSQFGSLGAATASGSLFGSSPFGASLSSFFPGFPYGGMASLPITGSDMYRNDFSAYGNSMGRHYVPYGAQQSFPSMFPDPAISSAYAKMLNNLPIPSTMDFGIPSLQGHSSPLGNGHSMMPPVGPSASQGGPPGKGYGKSSVIANMLNYFKGKATAGSSALPPSPLNALEQSQLLGSASSSLIDIAAQFIAPNNSSTMSHYNTLQQMSDYGQSNTALLPPNAGQQSTTSGLKISNITSLHKTNPSSAANSNAAGASFDSAKSLFNRSSEQIAISPMAGVSSPFSPRNVPLLSPTFDNQSRNNSAHLPISSNAMQSFSNTNTSSGTNVKTSAGITTPATITNQSVLMARSTAAPSLMNHSPTIISRSGKSPITINATRAGVSATKPAPTTGNIITTGTAQRTGSPLVSATGSLPPSKMTIIPTENSTTTAGSQRLSSPASGVATSASSLTVISSTKAVSSAGLQRTTSIGGSPTTSTMTVIPTANVSGMSYSYKDVGRKEVNINPVAVTSSLISTFGITNRLVGGVLVKTKTLAPMTNNKQDDPAEVVVLE